MKDYTKTIAEEVKNNREYLGLSQQELADKCGVPRHRIRVIEIDKAPTLNEFMALDKVFDGNLYWRLTEL